MVKQHETALVIISMTYYNSKRNIFKKSNESLYFDQEIDYNSYQVWNSNLFNNTQWSSQYDN